MYLKILETGHNAVQEQSYKEMEASLGHVPDPIRAFSYRRELFGRYFAVCYHQAMRGSSVWRIGELEIFAAFVSKLNQCEY